MHKRSRFQRKKKKTRNWRIQVLRGFLILAILVITGRLFNLQVIQASFYQSLASGQHSFYRQLFAERGDILIRDWVDDKEYIAATNESRAFVFADPRKIEDPKKVTRELSRILGYDIPPDDRIIEKEENIDTPNITEGLYFSDEEQLEISDIQDEEVDENGIAHVSVEEAEDTPNYDSFDILFARLSKHDDPYEPVIRGLGDDDLQRIIELDIDGIDYILEKGRSYPEDNIGGHIFGFVGQNENGKFIGRYGIEGKFDTFLAGTDGYLDSETDASGRWVGIGSRDFVPAEDGGDLMLTIDRTIQYIACKKLAEGVERYDADSGTIVIIEPNTGRIMAMCNVPDFDPETYNEVEDYSVYHNSSISIPYEPGSVFKPLIMAAAIDEGVVGPNTLYDDTGEEKIEEYTIRNSDLKANGMQSMTHVLEKSLNTGMIFVMRQLGMPKMLEYIENFGFGMMTGIDLTGEASGQITALDVQSEIFYATASYGQGITSTVLQLASSYSAIANGGMLMKPYIVEEMRYSDGRIEKNNPEIIRQVLSKKTTVTTGAMLVSVIENGHAKKAMVPGYFMAGKTGTAQVAKEHGRGYEIGHTKVTFAGFGPVEHPAFTMVVMMDNPKAVEWAADTVAPVFAEVSSFLVQYLQIPPTRSLE